MKQRIDATKVAPEAYRAMAQLQGYVEHSGLDKKIVHLVKVRASQINGCAYCIDMHTKEARHDGETEQRLYGLNAWRETPYYSDKERAALAWAESLTEIAKTHAPDDVYEEASRHFTEKELVDLSLAIVAINGWNRLVIGFRVEPGTYKVAAK